MHYTYLVCASLLTAEHPGGLIVFSDTTVADDRYGYLASDKQKNLRRHYAKGPNYDPVQSLCSDGAMQFSVLV